MSYFPITAKDQAEMLETIGVERFGQLFQAIPPELRNPQIELAPPLSELETQRWFGALAETNAHVKNYLSFLGAGCYEHFIPSIVRYVTSRGEFYTSYTPYQPEASQGTLQALFEYQSLMCELTGMDVSNGSHYDGATALAESILMALHETKRSKVLIARSVHPDYREVAKTYLRSTRFQIGEIPFGAHFELDQDHLKKQLNEDVGCVVAATPNFFGLMEDFTALENMVHQCGALLILVANPLSFGFYRTPKEWNADIACGEAQPLGIAPSYGGPWLGYIASTRSLLRRMPGRLVGLTSDDAGRRAFCLTLQAREQHIRRERASSNICTNEALCALAACVYLSSLGKAGLRRIAELNMENAYYLRGAMSNLKGVELLTNGPIFNEWTVRFKKSVSEINGKLFQKGIIGGFDLERFFPECKNQMLLSATETKTKEDLDQLIQRLKEILR